MVAEVDPMALWLRSSFSPDGLDAFRAVGGGAGHGATAEVAERSATGPVAARLSLGA